MQTRSQLTDELAMLLGGRTAEELVFGDPTTGAQNDIERASQIARAMVTEFGMTDALGPQQLGNRAGEPFMGRDWGSAPNYSDEIAALIDDEVGALIDRAHDQAERILTKHRRVLDELADALIEHETLDTPELLEILEHAGVKTAPTVTPRRATPARPTREATPVKTRRAVRGPRTAPGTA
jgi:cell division protease FtsH